MPDNYDTNMSVNEENNGSNPVDEKVEVHPESSTFAACALSPPPEQHTLFRPRLSDEQSLQEMSSSRSPEESSSPVLSPISLVSTCEEMNPSRRSSFEDCSIYAPAGTWNAPDENMAFFAIVDGHGGRDIVEFLEDALLYHVSQELQIEEDSQGDSGENPLESIPARLERSFLMTDIHSRAIGLMNSGATVALCLVTRGNAGLYPLGIDRVENAKSTSEGQNDNMENTWTIHAANAGDARIVLGYQGKAHRMTKDHRTDDPDEVRRIEDSGGFVFKGRVLGILAVTRSLGDHCMKEYVISKPYTSEKSITISHDNDMPFLILACDGLWDVFKDQEAVDFVVERILERELVAKYLVEEALKRGSTDNITVSVAFLT